jgi:sugar-phosphatase
MPGRFAERAFDALLFDMDGTILTSIGAAERVWSAWAVRHGLDLATFLPTIHGVQAIETIRRQRLPGVDAEAEAAAITEAEIADVAGIEPIAGAAEFLASLPTSRWAVVTSATRRLAARRIAAAGLALPETLIAAEDVARGKPAPDGFLLGAERLGVAIDRCLVLEDSAAGIAAGEAAGASLLVIAAAHASPLATTHPVILDYRGLRATPNADGALRIRAG